MIDLSLPTAWQWHANRIPLRPAPHTVRDIGVVKCNQVSVLYSERYITSAGDLWVPFSAYKSRMHLQVTLIRVKLFLWPLTKAHVYFPARSLFIQGISSTFWHVTRNPIFSDAHSGHPDFRLGLNLYFQYIVCQIRILSSRFISRYSLVEGIRAGVLTLEAIAINGSMELREIERDPSAFRKAVQNRSPTTLHPSIFLTSRASMLG